MFLRRCFHLSSAILLSVTLPAQTPANSAEGAKATLWAGMYGKDAVRMLLVRDGAKLTGWSWNLCALKPAPDAPPIQLIGTMDNSNFEFESETGCKIKGRATDKNLTGSLFSVSLVGAATPSDFPSPLPPTSSEWNVFVSRFRAAVQRHDTVALTQMMSPAFNLDFETHPQPGDLLHGVEPGFWIELSNALARPMTPRIHRTSRFVVDSRFAYTCIKCSEQGNVDFTKGLDGQWRWNGLFYSD